MLEHPVRAESQLLKCTRSTAESRFRAGVLGGARFSSGCAALTVSGGQQRSATKSPNRVTTLWDALGIIAVSMFMGMIVLARPGSGRRRSDAQLTGAPPSISKTLVAQLGAVFRGYLGFLLIALEQR